MKFNLLRSFCLAVSAVVALQSYSQDLLAVQAPVDKQMVKIDSVVLNRLLQAENFEFPADNLYPEWSNEYVHRYPNVTLPDSFLIDLSNFCMPTEHTKINDVFGYRPRRRRVHYGLDIKVNRGDTIRAPFDGKVRVSRYERRGYGNYLVIRHPNGLETVYGHLSKKLVEENQVVKVGDPIGLGGSTGRSTGPHLHFETRLLGTAINPALLFDFENQDVTGDSYLYKKPKKGVRAPGSPDSYYKVRPGDSLGRIAQKKGTTIAALCRLNRISRNSIIRPGQVLRCY